MRCIIREVQTPDAEDTLATIVTYTLRLDEWVVYTFALTKWYYDIVMTVGYVWERMLCS